MQNRRRSAELPKYYAWLQTAVAHSLGLPAGRQVGHHTDAAPKPSHCYFSSLSEYMIMRIDVQYVCKAEMLAFTDCDYC